MALSYTPQTPKSKAELVTISTLPLPGRRERHFLPVCPCSVTAPPAAPGDAMMPCRYHPSLVLLPNIPETHPFPAGSEPPPGSSHHWLALGLEQPPPSCPVGTRASGCRSHHLVLLCLPPLQSSSVLVTPHRSSLPELCHLCLEHSPPPLSARPPPTRPLY